MTTNKANQTLEETSKLPQKSEEQTVTHVVHHKTRPVHENNPVSEHTLKLPKYEEVALVLQGGGALGSYQAGIVEGLLEAGIEPTWIAGISIGALNTAIIAGNPPEKRVEMLHKFWDTICTPPMLPATSSILGNWINQLNTAGRGWLNNFEATRAMLEGQKGFFTPRFPLPLSFVKTTPDQISYYDISKLKETLLKFADFDLINNGKIRVSLGAVNIQTGNFAYFDNQNETLRPEHFMASGALPPGFPAIEIDGQYYWDGGLMSNTPLTEVLRSNGQKDKLIFQVDLWSSRGVLPTNFHDVEERTKDIQFSSRTRLVTDSLGKEHKNARMIKELLARIPESVKKNDPWCKKAQDMAKQGVVNVIQLIYKNKEYEGHSKDYEFSPITMQEHWISGLTDMRDTLKHPEWLDFPSVDKGFVTHDVHKHATRNVK
jgi:NTE family protein